MNSDEYRSKIVSPIMSGECDEFLDSIILSVRARKQDMAPSIWEFQAGDRIKLVNATPKYLVNALGTVRKVNRTKVVIDLDQKTGRFFRNITTPLSMIEKV